MRAAPGLKDLFILRLLRSSVTRGWLWRADRPGVAEADFVQDAPLVELGVGAFAGPRGRACAWLASCCERGLSVSWSWCGRWVGFGHPKNWFTPRVMMMAARIMELPGAVPAERTSMVFEGSVVVSGEATAWTPSPAAGAITSPGSKSSAGVRVSPRAAALQRRHGDVETEHRAHEHSVRR
jgi:hypothetical protein